MSNLQKVFIYPEGDQIICQGADVDVCAQGSDEQEALTRWLISFAFDEPPATPQKVITACRERTRARLVTVDVDQRDFGVANSTAFLIKISVSGSAELFSIPSAAATGRPIERVSRASTRRLASLTLLSLQWS
jgi:hypothetical protein